MISPQLQELIGKASLFIFWDRKLRRPVLYPAWSHLRRDSSRSSTRKPKSQLDRLRGHEFLVSTVDLEVESQWKLAA